MSTIAVRECNTMPEIDPYRADTGQLAAVAFWLRPGSETCGLGPDYDTGGMEADVYHNRAYLIRLAQFPDQDAAKAYLNGDAQPLLRAICDGHSISWDGNNMVGTLTEDATEVFDVLIDNLNTMKESEWTYWELAEWIEHENDLTDQTTDEEIAAMAEKFKADALKAKVIVGDIKKHLETERDWLRETGGVPDYSGIMPGT